MTTQNQTVETATDSQNVSSVSHMKFPVSYPLSYALDECHLADARVGAQGPIIATITQRCKTGEPGRHMIFVSFSHYLNRVPDIFRRELTKAGTRRGKMYDGAIIYVAENDQQDIFIR